MTTPTPLHIDHRPGPPDPRWWHEPDRPQLGDSPARVALVLIAVGVLVDLALQTRAAGVAAFAAVLVAAVGLSWCGRVRRVGGRVLLAVAVVLAACSMVRASPWLLVLDAVAVWVLVAFACSSERGAAHLGSTFAGASSRVLATLRSVVAAPPRALETFAALLPSRDAGVRSQLGPLLRGALLALPIVGVLGVVLALADPVFASLFQLDLDVAGAGWDLLVIAVTIWVLAGCFVQAGRPPVERSTASPSGGVVEGPVVMVGLTGIYAVFALSQWMVALRGADYVLRTTGLTYAEYARTGFFQLLAAAVLTALVLLWLRSSVAMTSSFSARLFSWLGVLASVLTLVVVHTALLRLHLYDQAFGLTRLRFFSTAFAWWLGVAFLLVALAFLLGRRSAREWLPTALGATAILLLLVVNAVDPDRLVLAHNLERHATGDGVEFDPWYAVELSSDAVPLLVESVGSLDEGDRKVVISRLCETHDPTAPVRWNLSSRAAASSLEQLCS